MSTGSGRAPASPLNACLRGYAVWIVLLAAAGAYAITMGIRQAMGLYLSPLNTATELGITSISLAFAFGQLWWGLAQPLAGAVADRIGTGRVILLGSLLIAVGTIITPLMTSTLGLTLALGVLAAGGSGVAGPSVLMAASARMLPPRLRGIGTGVVNAGGSLGQFAMAPIAVGLTAAFGWAASMQWLGVLALLALPAAWILRGNANALATAEAAQQGGQRLSVRDALARALTTPSYLLLGAGFFTCGFHVAFLATHLPGVIEACGLPPPVAGWSLALIGLFNIVGSVAAGWAGERWRMKSLLALTYAARALAILIFMVAPKTALVMFIFAAVMGVTFLSTVPPTIGLVGKMFGTANIAMLFGVLMLAHQVGGFLGAYLGGRIFWATQSYDLVWAIDIALALGAAVVNLPIREARVSRGLGAAAA